MDGKGKGSEKLRRIDPQECWQAVLGRDQNFNGTFVYAVRSTGIYCLPSCPSRRPQRNQVSFFSIPAAAEQAGYRPCLRCKPGQTDPLDPSAKMVQQACRHIEEHDSIEPLSLATLAAKIPISPHHLQRTFKRIMGITPRQYAEARRLGRLKALLREGKDVTSALYQAGYGSSSRLYEKAPVRLGMTPGTYIRGGKGMRIGYTLANCRLGRLLVAATERGICAVSLGDADDALTAALLAEYPDAEIRRNDFDLGEWVEALLRHLAGWQPHLDLPLDLRVTAFQWRVYEELRAIPYGNTRSYGEIATAIGKPNAVRAVANACAKNPVALIIPCHRVIRQGGDLAGYRWGIERKRSLLGKEQRP